MKTTKVLSRLFSISVCLAMLLMLLPMHSASAVSPNIVISQVYGGGGNSGATLKNDFIELFNLGSTTVDLTNWTVQYASAAGTTWQITALVGMLQPGQYYLIQEAKGSGGTVDLPTPDAIGTIAMSANNGKVALVNNPATLSGSCPAGLVDFVGYGTANCSETSPTPGLVNTTAALRKLDGAQDTDNNSADFTIGPPNPRNSLYPLVVIASATPNTLFTGDTTLLTVAVSSAVGSLPAGITVNGDLSSIGGENPQVFYDDATHGDVASGDYIFTFEAVVDAATLPGIKTLPIILADTEGVTINISISLNAMTLLPIGTVNGLVLDTDDGTAHTSPYMNQTVVIQGVIFEKTLQASSGSNTYKGFFIQNTAPTADSDPNSSDGIFVYMGTSSTMSGQTVPYTPAVGDEIILLGNVTEYFNMTELVSPFQVISILRSNVDLNAEVPPVVANPSISLVDANRYWERLQSMRVQVPQNSIVLGGRNVFSPADAEVWVARPDSTIALRPDPYTRRAFRDAHPLDDNYDPTNWDGNGYRILMGSLGIKATAGNAQELIAPARTFDTVTNAPVGGVNYTFSKYRVEISEQPVLNDGLDPALNNPPSEITDRSVEYSIADYNLENLYDYRDNPFSGCDFAGNVGCPAVDPFIGNVNSPFNYVPASDNDYQARLNDIANQIIDDLYSPDILMVQEVENQDFCAVSDNVLTCGTTDNADGKPDVLQELALKVASLGGPAYDAAFDRDSSDLRGIAPAFLYRTDRVELLSPDGDPVLGINPTIAGYTSVPHNSDISNPKTMNAVLPDGISACETQWIFPRAPGIALFRIYSTSVGVGNYGDVYVINNHFKSGPDTCVAHRTEQAKYNAALVDYIQAFVPGARIIIGGDLNVYPRPDDIAYGTSDQLGSLYDPNLGLINLWEILLGQAVESAYSYVYLGMAQTLDQMFINQNLLADLQQFRISHINSDFPADYSGDVARGTSDHDPNVATLNINDPPTVDAGGPYEVIEGSTVTLTATGTDPENGPLTYAWDLDNDGTFETSGQSVTFDASALTAPSSYIVRVQVTDNGGLTAADEATVNVIFKWTGYFPLIAQAPKLNQAKSGSSIPIKFSLGGDQGMDIFANGYPVAQPIDCISKTPEGNPTQIVITDAAYDPRVDQYIFIWKTIGDWKGTCQQLVVQLTDGTSHMAYFKFK